MCLVQADFLVLGLWSSGQVSTFYLLGANRYLVVVVVRLCKKQPQGCLLKHKKTKLIRNSQVNFNSLRVGQYDILATLNRRRKKLHMKNFALLSIVISMFAAISRSSRPEFRHFLLIITKFNAIWNVSIRNTTSENLFASLHCICLAFTHIARSNAITQCIFLTHGITDGLSVLENSIYCTELRWRAIC